MGAVARAQQANMSQTGSKCPGPQGDRVNSLSPPRIRRGDGEM